MKERVLLFHKADPLVDLPVPAEEYTKNKEDYYADGDDGCDHHIELEITHDCLPDSYIESRIALRGKPTTVVQSPIILSTRV